MLKNRLNRRLVKLAKWADSSADERHAEFRNSANMNYPYRTLTKPMLYSKPIPLTEINKMKNVKVPSFYHKASSKIASPEPVKAVPKETPPAAGAEESKEG